MSALPYLLASFGILIAAFITLWIRHRSVSRLQPTLERLKESEERLRIMIESAHDAFVAINSDGIIINWNKQAEKIFGWTEKEALSRQIASVIIPERYRAAHALGMKRFMKTGTGPVINKRIELMAMHREGHEIPIEMTISPFQHGDTYYFGSFLQDISERKKSESVQKAQFAITEILSEQSSLGEAAPMIIQAICDNLGWSAGELWLQNAETLKIGCHCFWSRPEVNSKDLQTVTEKTSLAIGEGIPGRVWATKQSVWIDDIAKDQNFPRAQIALESGMHRAVAFPISTDNDVVGVMGFFSASAGKADAQLIQLMTDIGKRIAAFIQRRFAEERLAGMMAELEQRVHERTQELADTNYRLASANRLKDEFLATVSHELRTPLNVMQGHSELLLARHKFESEVERSLSAIHRNAKSQGVIINDLLDVSRIITGKLKLNPTSIDLRELVQRSIESIAIAAKVKNIRLVEEISIHAHSSVLADFDRLQQVLWNLLTNAVKFTPRDGTITILVKDYASRVEICVRDTGIGMEPAFLPFVFDRFRQEDASTTRAHGGLGLGMAIARHIVELHGGTIEVLSAGKDQGSEFKISLPFLEAGEFSESAKVASKSSPAARPMLSGLAGIRALLVDDDPDTLVLTQTVLEAAGAHVTTAASADEALAKKNSQDFDVIVSDIGMAGKDGYTLIKDFPSIPAVALTAYAADTDREKSLASGFRLHLVKPIDGGELVKALKDLLGL